MAEELDRWDRFWSAYMVWLLRLVSYFCNFLFLEPIQNLLVGGLGSELAFEVLVLVYSVIVLGVIEKTIGRRFNPKYEHLSLTPEQLAERVAKERLLLSCFAYSAFNCLLGMSIGFAAGAQALESPATGLFAMVASVFAVFLGVVLLVARFGEPGRRQPVLYPFGVAAFLAPTAFVVYMALRVFWA